MVIGHEFVGEVVRAGSNVMDFLPGEVVSAEGLVVCGRCRNCLAGRRHLCKDTVGIGVNRAGAASRAILFRVELKERALGAPFATSYALSSKIFVESKLPSKRDDEQEIKAVQDKNTARIKLIT